MSLAADLDIIFVILTLEYEAGTPYPESVHSNMLPDVNTFVRDVADFGPIRLCEVETVFQALSRIRGEAGKERTRYFYVTDTGERLVGVVPTRRLLLADPAALIGEVMVHPVLSVAESDTFGNALAILAGVRLFALPVVDASGRLTAVVDISGITQTMVDLERRELPEGVFQMVGMRTGEHGAKALRRVSHRFLWLLIRMIGALVAALTVYLFGGVVRKNAGIVFFIPAVVMIAECAAMQAVTLSIVNGHMVRQQIGRLWQEVGLAWLVTIIGAAFVSAALAYPLGLVPLAVTVCTSLLVACASGTLLGYSVPRLLRRWRLAAKVASGPVVLALSDVSALLGYLAISAVLV